MIASYERHSPTKLNLFAAAPAMFVLEHVLGVKQPVGAPAHRGTAVEAGVTCGLEDLGAPLRRCVDRAMARYDTLMAFSADPRRDHYRTPIGDMVEAALKELRKYGKPSATQVFVEWKPDGLKLPIVGYSDFEWHTSGILADLKTTEKMPSQIKAGHARQVSLYAASDNVDARLIYVTPKKIEAYRLENVREHRAALVQIARRVEKFLALSDDAEFYLSITVPDTEAFYWSNPAARQLAFEYWGV